MIQGFLKTTYTQPRKTGQLHGWNVDPIDVNHQEPGYCWHVLIITKVKFLSSWMEGWLQGTLGKNRLLLFQDSRPLLSCSFQASLSVLFIRGHATHLLVTSAKQRLTDKTFSCSTPVGVDSKDFRSSYSMLQTLYSCTPNYTPERISWLFWCSDCKGKQVVPLGLYVMQRVRHIFCICLARQQTILPLSLTCATAAVCWQFHAICRMICISSFRVMQSNMFKNVRMNDAYFLGTNSPFLKSSLDLWSSHEYHVPSQLKHLPAVPAHLGMTLLLLILLLMVKILHRLATLIYSYVFHPDVVCSSQICWNRFFPQNISNSYVVHRMF